MSNSTAAAPGYVVGESRSESLIAIVTCMVTLSTIVLVLRVWTRARVQGIPSGADEWTILVSWLFSVAFTINVCTPSLELFYYGEATYYITVSLTKMSILFLYLKLISQWLYCIVSWSMMAFVALTGFTCVLVDIFQCNPIHKAWHTEVPGTCFNQVALYLSNAGLNILQDLIIYFPPVKTFWGHLERSNMVVDRVQREYRLRLFVHLKPLIARYAPSMLSIQRTTRLPDERSGATDNSKVRSMGRSTTSKNRPFGILTEMELEDNDQATLVQSTAHNPMSDNPSDGYPPTTPRDMNGQPSGIHKMTRVTILYADRDAGRVSESGTGG
ncbi:hypothetical protein DL765_005580 [Monosporascus sp. GIB2]|nr:hypothetical protein DL765_005580 [Monosporascus sp. GIB2]